METQSATPKPKRRWLQFGLRTMFIVVTIFCVWFGWQANIVHQRKAAFADLDRDGQNRKSLADNYTGGYQRGPRVYKDLPFWRRWMGDEGMAFIELEEKYASEIGLAQTDKLQELFPEARLSIRPLRGDGWRYPEWRAKFARK